MNVQERDGVRVWADPELVNIDSPGTEGAAVPREMLGWLIARLLEVPDATQWAESSAYYEARIALANVIGALGDQNLGDAAEGIEPAIKALTRLRATLEAI